jgi:hypothetical protein
MLPYPLSLATPYVQQNPTRPSSERKAAARFEVDRGLREGRNRFIWGRIEMRAKKK